MKCPLAKSLDSAVILNVGYMLEPPGGTVKNIFKRAPLRYSDLITPSFLKALQVNQMCI